MKKELTDLFKMILNFAEAQNFNSIKITLS